MSEFLLKHFLKLIKDHLVDWKHLKVCRLLLSLTEDHWWQHRVCLCFSVKLKCSNNTWSHDAAHFCQRSLKWEVSVWFHPHWGHTGSCQCAAGLWSLMWSFKLHSEATWTGFLTLSELWPSNRSMELHLRTFIFFMGNYLSTCVMFCALRLLKVQCGRGFSE